MINSRRQLLKHLAQVYDLAAFVSSFLMTTFLLYSWSGGRTLPDFMMLRIKLGNCVLFALLILAWYNILVISKLYVSKRLTNLATEIYEVSKSALGACLFLYLSARILHIHLVNIRFATIVYIFCTTNMVLGRVLAKRLLARLRQRGRNTRFLLVVGTNERAIEFADAILERPELGYNIVGFVDEDWDGIAKFQTTGHSRCCAFDGLADFLRHNVVDEAAIFLPLRSYYEYSARLISLCEQHGIVIRVGSQVFNLKGDLPRLVLDENSQVATAGGANKTWSAFIKRGIDWVVSLGLLIILSPLLAFIAVVVKYTSTGPILFRQTRVGINKRQFRMYKFRTMIADAERMQDGLLSINEMTGPVFKVQNDPRVTRVGRILRKTSVDELPQLLNVLKGEMSLVGPRAMSLRDYKLFEHDWHRRRFSVKPGITCLWQVNGRSSIPFEKWMELDMQYIDKWSLWLDFKILARTVSAVVRGTGAA
jgi:exopolysaccharide biosynthesis polyprenyl glycosylphosphotransferase